MDESLETPYTENTDKWSISADGTTLILNGFNFTTSGRYALSIFGGNIEANGTNNIASTNSNGYGIYSDDNSSLVISGTGTLNLQGNEAAFESRCNPTINGATITGTKDENPKTTAQVFNYSSPKRSIFLSATIESGGAVELNRCKDVTISFVSGDTYSVNGKITGSDTAGAGIAGATVQLKSGGSNSGSSVTTDTNGDYTISDVANGTYTIDVSKTGYDNGTIASFSVTSANVTGKNLMLTKSAAPTYTVTLTVNKDGSNNGWAHGKTFYLYQSGSSQYTGTGAGGTVTFSTVANGTYDIYDGTTDTGVDVTVNSVAASATLDYYTVQFAVISNSPAAGSTISATYNSSVITTGDIVLGGKTLIITAVGAGATSYTYAWTGAGTNSETSAALTKTNLAEKVNATCTVTGGNDPAYTLTVTGANGTVTGGGSYTSGQEVSITATPDNGYSFNGWISSNGGTFANESSASTTFTMPGNATTVTAGFISNPGGAPVITTTSLANGTVGRTYSQTLTATGDATITWSTVSGSGDLPAGLTLNSDGTITGTPEALGTSTFDVKAVNSVGNDTKTLSITIAAVPPKQEETVHRHEHNYQWIIITDASLNTDGIEQYKCSCGDVKETLIISATQVYIKGLYGEIKDTAEGALVDYDSGRWTGITDKVIKMLAERPDVIVKLTFEYKNERYTFTLPAGTSYEALLQDEETYYGFFTFCKLLGIPVSKL